MPGFERFGRVRAVPEDALKPKVSQRERDQSGLLLIMLEIHYFFFAQRLALTNRYVFVLIREDPGQTRPAGAGRHVLPCRHYQPRRLPLYTAFIQTGTLCRGGRACDFRFARHVADAGDGRELRKSV